VRPICDLPPRKANAPSNAASAKRSKTGVPSAVAITLEQLQLITADHSKHNPTAFDCGHEDLNDFIKNDCPGQIEKRLSVTKLALYDGAIVGYITLLADSITLHPDEQEGIAFKQVPALKIGRLGIEKKYQNQRIGTALMRYAVGVAIRMNDGLGVGCRFLTVDADPNAIKFYADRGFVMSQHRDYKKKDYPNMHYDIIQGPPIG
jgi:GNAT superfamily N-acetyltransferase